MDERRRRDQGVAFSARIGYVQLGALHRDRRIYREYATRKRGHDMPLQPGPHQGALLLSRRSSKRIPSSSSSTVITDK